MNYIFPLYSEGGFGGVFAGVMVAVIVFIAICVVWVLTQNEGREPDDDDMTSDDVMRMMAGKRKER